MDNQQKKHDTENNHGFSNQQSESSNSVDGENPHAEDNSTETQGSKIENFKPDEEFEQKFAALPPDENQNDEWQAEPHRENNRQTIISSGAKVLKPTTPVRRLAEGALMTALAVILGAAAFYTPLFNTLLLILYPIPVAYLIKRHGIATGLLSFAASALLLILLLGIPNAAFVVLSMGAVGIWYGIAFRQGIRPIRILGVGTVLAALSAAFTTLLSLWTMGISIDGITEYMTQYVDKTVSLLQSAGIFDMLSGGMSVQEYSAQMVDMLTSLVPGMIIVIAMLEALICYILTSYLLRRLGLSAQTLPKFRDWHLGWPALWGLIIALLAYIGYHYLEYEYLKTAALNILYIYYPLLMINGIAILVWLCKNTRSCFLPIVIIIGLFVLPSASLITVLMFGLFDTIVDFRNWIKRSSAKRGN